MWNDKTHGVFLTPPPPLLFCSIICSLFSTLSLALNRSLSLGSYIEFTAKQLLYCERGKQNWKIKFNLLALCVNDHIVHHDAIFGLHKKKREGEENGFK